MIKAAVLCLFTVLCLFISGCTQVQLKSGQFIATRTAIFTEIAGDLELSTPDGATLKLIGLQSTVDKETLSVLLAKIPIAP